MELEILKKGVNLASTAENIERDLKKLEHSSSSRDRVYVKIGEAESLNVTKDELRILVGIVKGMLNSRLEDVQKELKEL